MMYEIITYTNQEILELKSKCVRIEKIIENNLKACTSFLCGSRSQKQPWNNANFICPEVFWEQI